MGQQQSKDELLYEKAIDGNVESIKALCLEGAGLEWIDREGKTPLIVACMKPKGFVLTKTLIELGANVNTYRPGCHAGTPLHHAAKRGLDQTVRLLLSDGANPLVRNDDGQTPLDVARRRGFNNVVHAIESHICLFSGWLREFYGPGFLEALAPQLLSRKIWAVIIPHAPDNPMKPLKLELIIYSTFRDTQPRATVALWKADIEEPKFHQSDLMLIIFDKSTKTRYKFASATDGDKQQIQSLYNACKGIPQLIPTRVPHDTQASVLTTAIQTAAEAMELAMGINASIQSAMDDRLPVDNHPSCEAINENGWRNAKIDTIQIGWGSFGGSPPLEASSIGWLDEPIKEEHNGWGVPESRPDNHSTSGANRVNGWANAKNDRIQNELGSFGGSPTLETSSSGWLDEPTKEEYNGWGEVSESRPSNNPVRGAHTPHSIPSDNKANASSVFVCSAPPIPEKLLDEGPIRYPSIDFSPDHLSTPGEHADSGTAEAKYRDCSSCCVICWEAPIEGACIPCGHMVGCMTCLNEIETKIGDCPVCRAKVNQVVRLYAV